MEKNIADRTREIEIVSDYCAGKYPEISRCLILKTTRDSGLTTFLEYMSKNQSSSVISIYVNCTSTDPEAIYTKFFSTINSQRGLRLLTVNWTRGIGTIILQMVGAALTLIPGFGRPLGVLVAGTAPNLFFTPYPSENAEHFANVVTSKLWNKEVVFFVDNAQKLEASSLNLFRLTHSDNYHHIRYVLGYVEESSNQDSVENFRRKFSGAGYTNTSVKDFIPPDEIFVKELAEKQGLNLQRADCTSLLSKAQRNANVIVELLRSYATSTPPEPVDSLQIEILRYLYIAEQPLQFADLVALSMRSQRIVMQSSSHFENCIKKLELNRYVLRIDFGDAAGAIELISQSKGELRKIAESHGLNLPAANELFDYFSEISDKGSLRHAPSSYYALLYRLSSKLFPEKAPDLAMRLIDISLAQGDLERANQYIQSALPKQENLTVSNYYTLLAFYISVREFYEASRIIEQIGEPMWRRDRHLSILHAIITNRIRDHHAANVEFEKLLKSTETTPEEWALITSYQVAGHLHEGDFQSAQKVFLSNRSYMLTARNYAYALRNCASAFFWGEDANIHLANELLEESIRRFTSTNDEYGRLTALTNYGSCKAVNRNREGAECALPYFKESYMGLCRFGTHHLDESGGNYAISLMISGNTSEAKTLLGKLSAILSHDFPLVVVRCALAILELQDGNSDNAWGIMQGVIESVQDNGLSEATFRAASNAALIAGALGKPNPIVQGFLEMARKSGFDGDKQQLLDLDNALMAGDINPKNIIRHFSYDYFQYWSQNPLSVIPQPNLSL